jgi:sialidase-1
MRILIYLFFFFICIHQLFSQKHSEFSEQILFKNGQEGYACYRIPAIIHFQNKKLLAFAEGRVDGCNDFGNVDIVMKSSDDGGLNWSKQQILINNRSSQVGNPAPVVDLHDPLFPSGRIFLFFNTGTQSEQNIRNGNGERGVWFITSEDFGMNWSPPTEITQQVHFNKHTPNYEKDWRTHANTPGHGIQFNEGVFKGRIYVPANHSTGNPQSGFNEYNAYGYFSDDHGKSWQVSEDVPIASSNEAIGTVLPNGELMLNIRQQSGTTKRRLIARSNDGGQSWDSVYFDPELITPVCQSSLFLFQNATHTLLLYSGPNSTEERIRMTLKASENNGATWPIKKEIYAGISAYSDLTQINESQIGLLFEKENKTINFVLFSIDWLLN